MEEAVSEVQLQDLAPNEKGPLSSVAERDKREGPPRFRLVRKGRKSLGVEALGDGEKAFKEKLIRATGTTDFDFSVKLLNQIAAVFFADKPSARIDCLNLGAAFLYGIKPEDPIEAMLAVQMMGTHNLATEFLRRAGAKEQTLERFCQNVSGATKLLRTYAAQMEALNRYRTKGEQKVKVEHIQVGQMNLGGQVLGIQTGEGVHGEK